MGLERLSSKELTKEFHNMIKEAYPDIELQELRDIVYAPWRFGKKAMESGELPQIQFKYFGKFSVRKRRAQCELKEIKERFENGSLDHGVYFRLKKMLEIYLTKELKRRIGNGKGESNTQEHNSIPPGEL